MFEMFELKNNEWKFIVDLCEKLEEVMIFESSSEKVIDSEYRR